eukprot:CAMPEP_0175116434 /NCGR_PEP_ID=MMETSP0086_2-20121207/18178_1 /TAXON_ID=136419 /ORGANISM="Unknown Unknown, Strain D1" /LENGTH=85 /DNA_ID=CAMNT_0016396731 /DNA_START=9 /DNA_END=266 /DNA_ORIENTATION=-
MKMKMKMKMKEVQNETKKNEMKVVLALTMASLKSVTKNERQSWTAERKIHPGHEFRCCLRLGFPHPEGLEKWLDHNPAQHLYGPA